MAHDWQTADGESLFQVRDRSHVLEDGSSDPSVGPFARRTQYIVERVASGQWREGRIPAAQAGLTRDLRIFLASRKSSPIVHDWHGDKNTFCPPLYWDLAHGSGALCFAWVHN